MCCNYKQTFSCIHVCLAARPSVHLSNDQQRHSVVRPRPRRDAHRAGRLRVAVPQRQRRDIRRYTLRAQEAHGCVDIWKIKSSLHRETDCSVDCDCRFRPTSMARTRGRSASRWTGFVCPPGTTSELPLLLVILQVRFYILRKHKKALTEIYILFLLFRQPRYHINEAVRHQHCTGETLCQ